MTSVVVAVLVVTLLLPGFALLVAVVVRFLLDGAPPPERSEADPGSDSARDG